MMTLSNVPSMPQTSLASIQALSPARSSALDRMRARGNFGWGNDSFATAASLPTPEPRTEHILDYVRSAPEFHLKEAFDPGSSSATELVERKRELDYRLEWLAALTHLTEEELKLLNSALAKLEPASGEDGM
jgi:hypothetical protein